MTRSISSETSSAIETIASMLSNHMSSGAEALEWLKTPQKRYQDLSPLDYLSSNTNGASEILENLSQGIF